MTSSPYVRSLTRRLAAAVDTWQCGCTTMTRSPSRHRQLHDVKRLAAAHQHEPAHHARRDVVGMGRSRRRALTFDGAEHHVAGRERPAKDLVRRERAGRAAGARAPKSARQRHLFVQPQTQPVALPARRSTIDRGAACDVLHRVSRQTSPVARNLDDLDAWHVRQLGLEHVSGAAECQTKHVKTWPNIGNGGGREHAESLTCHEFVRLSHYDSEIAWRGMEQRGNIGVSPVNVRLAVALVGVVLSTSIVSAQQAVRAESTRQSGRSGSESGIAARGPRGSQFDQRRRHRQRSPLR